MAGGKLSPRQKMINMMYLVLIALLALNVSKEIIKAFNLIENSLDKSTASISSKNQTIRDAMGKEDRPEAKAALKWAKEAQKYSNEFIKEIQGIKEELLKRTGDGKDPAKGRKDPKEEGAVLIAGGKPELLQGDNMEAHANYFVNEKHGKRVQDLINNARTKMLSVMDEAAKDGVLGGKSPELKKVILDAKKNIESNTSLYANDQKNSDGNMQSWSSMFLEHSPLAGVFAILSKLENDARNMEGQISEELAKSVSATDYKFDKTLAVVSTDRSAMLVGESMKAKVILAAFSSQMDLKMSVGGSGVNVVDGVGEYTVTGSSPGEFTQQVNIQVPKPGGGFETKSADFKYTVFSPSAAISADQLNVLYVGLENPLSISVSGVNPKDVMVSAGSPVQLVGGNGSYKALIAARNGVNEVNIAVSAKLPGGKIQTFPPKKFKIRNVPTPIFAAGGVRFTGPVSSTVLSAQTTALAVMDNFIYEGVKWSIISYKFICVSRKIGYKEVPVNGNSLAPVAGLIRSLGTNDMVQFTSIRAQGPGGEIRPLPNASCSIQ